MSKNSRLPKAKQHRTDGAIAVSDMPQILKDGAMGFGGGEAKERAILFEVAQLDLKYTKALVVGDPVSLQPVKHRIEVWFSTHRLGVVPKSKESRVRDILQQPHDARIHELAHRAVWVKVSW